MTLATDVVVTMSCLSNHFGTPRAIKTGSTYSQCNRIFNFRHGRSFLVPTSGGDHLWSGCFSGSLVVDASRKRRTGGVTARTLDQRTNYVRYDVARALVETALRELKRDRQLLSEHRPGKTLRLKRRIGG